MFPGCGGTHIPPFSFAVERRGLAPLTPHQGQALDPQVKRGRRGNGSPESQFPCRNQEVLNRPPPRRAKIPPADFPAHRVYLLRIDIEAQHVEPASSGDGPGERQADVTQPKMPTRAVRSAILARIRAWLFWGVGGVSVMPHPLRCPQARRLLHRGVKAVGPRHRPRLAKARILCSAQQFLLAQARIKLGERSHFARRHAAAGIRRRELARIIEAGGGRELGERMQCRAMVIVMRVALSGTTSARTRVGSASPRPSGSDRYGSSRIECSRART